MDVLERAKSVVKWLIDEGEIKSQSELAARMGYNESSISQILTGRVKLSDKFISKLAQVSSSINPKYFKEEDAPMILVNADSEKDKRTVEYWMYQKLLDRISELEQENAVLRFQLSQYTNIEKVSTAV